jgi:tRNA modification GTPase
MKYTQIFTSPNLDGKREVLDNGLVVYFPEKSSLTGEDMIEFHLHGGLAIIDHFLAQLGKLGSEIDLRQAEKGEFLMRGYSNEKISLLEVEEISDSLKA